MHCQCSLSGGKDISLILDDYLMGIVREKVMSKVAINISVGLTLKPLILPFGIIPSFNASINGKQ
jgi:hypothetical protein